MESIVIPESVISIEDYAFQGTKIVNINIPDNVNNIGIGVFDLCYNLESVVFPEGLTTLSTGFFACSALKSITIPASVTKIWIDFDMVELQNITIITPKGSYAEAYAKENNIAVQNN